MFTKEQFWPRSNGFLHHAFLIEGEPAELMPQVLSVVEEISGEKAFGNPDVYLTQSAKFIIDQARDIRDKAWRRPFGRGPKFFVIAAGSLTTEAAQALLKIFEEPPSQTHFFLLVPSISVVLPTLRSRFFVISAPGSARATGPRSGPAKEFLQGTPAQRFQILEMFSQEDEDGETEDNFGEIRSFLAELEIFLLSQPADLKYLNDLSLARKYLDDRSVNSRMILEHLAIVLPKY